jgi:hypothetical protein
MHSAHTMSKNDGQLVRNQSSLSFTNNSCRTMDLIKNDMAQSFTQESATASDGAVSTKPQSKPEQNISQTCLLAT